MKRVALIGFPVSHSISPQIHNAAFSALNLPWQYEALETPPNELPQTIARLRSEEWVGANVTIPHKEDVIALIDEVSPQAKRTGAVNTIVNDNGHLKGDNTDVAGFLIDLKAQGVEVAGKNALILGSGGAARAVAFGLAAEGSHIRLICRNVRHGKKIVEDLGEMQDIKFSVFPWTKESYTLSSQCSTLIVNATPLGTFPHINTSPWPPDTPFPNNAFIYDLVYNPPVTRLIMQARAAGLQACNGLGMLIEQGALASKFWTGLEPPHREMYTAAHLALERQHA